MEAFTVSTVDKTLNDGEIGVLFIDRDRRIIFPDTIRVIRMHPFDPSDYLNHHRIKLKIKK